MQIDFSIFGDRALNVVRKAFAISRNCNYVSVDPSVMMVALIQEDKELFANVMQIMEVEQTGFCQELSYQIQRLPKSSIGDPQLNEASLRVLSEAMEIARMVGAQSVTIDFLLMALCYMPSCVEQVFSAYSIDEDAINSAILEYRGRSFANNNTVYQYQYLSRFARNLCLEAEEGRIENAVGRDEEVLRILEILARRTKNNPLLVGESGVGKTVIIEGLACRIQIGDVPRGLASLKIYALDLPMLLAGAVPGEFEVRFKNLLTEISESEENIVLFVDDVHQLIGAGLTMGAMDAANILKPVMAGGKVKIIGAITTDEYKKYIEKDKAFSRRFQRINIDEPSIEEAIAILQGVKGRLEQHHHLTIEDEAIESAVKLSARYITDRCLPDKAIDLVDEAAAHLRLAKPLATRSLTHDDIQGIVARVTGIPAMKMNEDEESKLLNLESYLRQSVIGQDSALEKIAKAIRRSRMGMSDENRPIGSFLFMGSTGVGKTETCKALAEYLFDSREMMIRIDMSEYQQEQSVARLFGAPPGYIGYEQGGQLTEAVRHKSYSVVLFDELEKAHPKIFESLLQVLDDGRMTDGQGRVVNFKNTIVVMTSNIQSIEQLRHRVAPEFINRIDDIVTYNQLDIEQIRRIAKVQIDGLQAKLQDQGIALQVDSSVCDFLTQKGFNPEYGARPVKRAINSYLLDNLSTAVLAKDIDRNRPIYSEMNGDCITFHN